MSVRNDTCAPLDEQRCGFTFLYCGARRSVSLNSRNVAMSSFTRSVAAKFSASGLYLFVTFGAKRFRYAEVLFLP